METRQIAESWHEATRATNSSFSGEELRDVLDHARANSGDIVERAWSERRGIKNGSRLERRIVDAALCVTWREEVSG